MRNTLFKFKTNFALTQKFRRKHLKKFYVMFINEFEINIKIKEIDHYQTKTAGIINLIIFLNHVIVCFRLSKLIGV